MEKISGELPGHRACCFAQEDAMVREKAVVRKIENTTRRQVTFSRRKSGLFKKAKELGILCDAEVGVILFSITGRLYEYSNFRMKSTIERYRLVKEGQQLLSSRDEAKLWQAEAARMEQQLHNLREKHRLLLGHHLTGLSLEDLKSLENQIEISLHNIRLTKDKLMLEEIHELNKNETIARQENTELHRKLNIIRQENIDLQNKLIWQTEVKRGIQSYNSAAPHGKHSIFLEHSHTHHAERRQ